MSSYVHEVYERLDIKLFLTILDHQWGQMKVYHQLYKLEKQEEHFRYLEVCIGY